MVSWISQFFFISLLFRQLVFFVAIPVLVKSNDTINVQPQTLHRAVPQNTPRTVHQTEIQMKIEHQLLEEQNKMLATQELLAQQKRKLEQYHQKKLVLRNLKKQHMEVQKEQDELKKQLTKQRQEQQHSQMQLQKQEIQRQQQMQVRQAQLIEQQKQVEKMKDLKIESGIKQQIVDIPDTPMTNGSKQKIFTETIWSENGKPS